MFSINEPHLKKAIIAYKNAKVQMKMNLNIRNLLLGGDPGFQVALKFLKEFRIKL